MGIIPFVGVAITIAVLIALSRWPDHLSVRALAWTWPLIVVAIGVSLAVYSMRLPKPENGNDIGIGLGITFGAALGVVGGVTEVAVARRIKSRRY